MLRHNQCPISSAIQGHHVLSSEHLAQSTEHTAVWLASEEKSRGWSVLWREPKSSIRFQMCAIWLITSVKRIKLWFYIILFTWLSISQNDKIHFSESRVNNLQFPHTELCRWIMAWEVHNEKLQTSSHRSLLVSCKNLISHISGTLFSFYCSW